MNRLCRFRCFVAGLLAALVLLPALPAGAATILNETFSYPDGALIAVSGSNWVNNYAPTGEVDVVGGRLFLTDAENESVRANFATAYPTNVPLYASFTATFTALPQGQGNFFAFFRVSDVDNLRCRVWVSTNGAAPGKFRLGVVNNATDPAMIPSDLSLDTPYRVVMRLRLSDLSSRVWVNPLDETDLTRSAEYVGTVGLSPTRHFGFLQTSSFQLGSGNSMGRLFVDDLRVGTTFADVAFARWTAITPGAGGTNRLVASGPPNLAVNVQAGADPLATNGWSTLGSATFGTNGVLEYLDAPAGSVSNRFYRLVLP